MEQETRGCGTFLKMEARSGGRGTGGGGHRARRESVSVHTAGRVRPPKEDPEERWSIQEHKKA